MYTITPGPMRRRFESIHARLAAYETAALNTAISEQDDMFDASGLDQYSRIGRSAVYAISHAMMLTGLDRCPRVLDLPCGFGRVLRHLIAFFPESHFVACDLNTEAVDYCKKTFNVEGVYGRERFDYEFDSQFDLIWCGSLLTHLPEDKFRQAITFLIRNLAKEGVALVTLHGRFSLTVHETYSKLLPDDLFLHVKREFLTSGFGYREYEAAKGTEYGLSLTSPSYVLSVVEKIEEVQIAGYSEREWAGNHDVLMIRKKPISALFPGTTTTPS